MVGGLLYSMSPPSPILGRPTLPETKSLPGEITFCVVTTCIGSGSCECRGAEQFCHFTVQMSITVGARAAFGPDRSLVAHE